MLMQYICPIATQYKYTKKLKLVYSCTDAVKVEHLLHKKGYVSYTCISDIDEQQYVSYTCISDIDEQQYVSYTCISDIDEHLQT